MLKGIDRVPAGDDGASLANYTALRASVWDWTVPQASTR